MYIVTFVVFLVQGGKDVGVYVQLSTAFVVLQNTFLLTLLKTFCKYSVNPVPVQLEKYLNTRLWRCESNQQNKCGLLYYGYIAISYVLLFSSYLQLVFSQFQRITVCFAVAVIFCLLMGPFVSVCPLVMVQ